LTSSLSVDSFDMRLRPAVFQAQPLDSGIDRRECRKFP
jgi:hypothetical protein